jgi:hypothetical protein
VVGIPRGHRFSFSSPRTDRVPFRLYAAFLKRTGRLCRMDRTASAGIARRAESTVPKGTHSQPPCGQNAGLAGRSHGNRRTGPHLLGEIAPGNSHCAPTTYLVLSNQIAPRYACRSAIIIGGDRPAVSPCPSYRHGRYCARLRHCLTGVSRQRRRNYARHCSARTVAALVGEVVPEPNTSVTERNNSVSEPNTSATERNNAVPELNTSATERNNAVPELGCVAHPGTVATDPRLWASRPELPRCESPA